MMCVEESLIVHSSSNSNKNNNSSNNSTPSNPPSSSSSAVDKLNSSGGTADRFPRQRQPAVVQWAKCLHCPRTWKCRDQPDDPSEARLILDVPYQGLTKFVPCNECKPPSLPATTSIGQQQQQSKQIESNNQAAANMLLQQFAANPILSAGLGLNSATQQQQQMNMFNLLPLLYQQMQQNANASRLPGIIAAAGQAELFQSMLQQTLLQQQGSDGGKRPPVVPPKRDNHYRQPPARAPKEEPKPQQAANNIDLNRTRVALAAKPASSSGLQLDERRLTSILEAATRPYLTSSGTGADDKLKTSQMLRFNGASELCKRLEDKDQPKKFTSPAMQSLAEIGRSPGAIWNGGGGVESGHSDAGGVETSHFPCATCGKSFKNRSLLKIHQRAHVTSDGQHKCHVCDYVTADAHALVAHMQRRHSGAVDANSPSSNGGGAYGNGSHQQQQQQQEAASPVKCKPAICPVCGRKSPSLGYLKIHMRSHKTTLDHVCHVCGRGFKEHWYLTTHLRTHDKGLVNGHPHHHHPHHPQYGASNATPTAPQRQVQHNEVQQQLRLMIERNQRNSEAYRVALKSAAAASTAANPLFPMPAPTNGGGCRSLSGHSGDDCCSSATPSPPMRNEEDSLESRNRAVSKRKAFHPVKCSQNEAGTEPPAAKRLATEAAVAGMTMAPHHHQQPQQHDDQQVFGRRKSKPQKLDVVEGADTIDLSLVKEESGTLSEEENKVVRPLVHKHHLRLASDTRESSSSSSSQPLDLRVLKLSDGSSSKSLSPASNGRSVSF